MSLPMNAHHCTALLLMLTSRSQDHVVLTSTRHDPENMTSQTRRYALHTMQCIKLVHKPLQAQLGQFRLSRRFQSSSSLRHTNHRFRRILPCRIHPSRNHRRNLVPQSTRGLSTAFRGKYSGSSHGQNITLPSIRSFGICKPHT